MRCRCRRCRYRCWWCCNSRCWISQITRSCCFCCRYCCCWCWKWSRDNSRWEIVVVVVVHNNTRWCDWRRHRQHARFSVCPSSSMSLVVNNRLIFSVIVVVVVVVCSRRCRCWCCGGSCRWWFCCCNSWLEQKIYFCGWKFIFFLWNLYQKNKYILKCKPGWSWVCSAATAIAVVVAVELVDRLLSFPPPPDVIIANINMKKINQQQIESNHDHRAYRVADDRSALTIAVDRQARAPSQLLGIWWWIDLVIVFFLSFFYTSDFLNGDIDFSSCFFQLIDHF